MTRRTPKLIAENEPERCWRLRAADGSVREPLNFLHIRALVETGVANAESEVAGIGTETWQRLGGHPLWPDVRPPERTARLSIPAAADQGVIPITVQEATPRMQAVWSEKREEAKAVMIAHASAVEKGQLLKALAFASAVAGLICVGDIIVFTCEMVTAFVFLAAFVRLLAIICAWRITK